MQSYLDAQPEALGWGARRVPEELYELDVAPHEAVNVVDAPAYADALANLRARLDDHMDRTRDPFLDRPFETMG